MRFGKYQSHSSGKFLSLDQGVPRSSVDESGSTRSDCLRSAKEIGGQMELRISGVSTSTHGNLQPARPF